MTESLHDRRLSIRSLAMFVVLCSIIIFLAACSTDGDDEESAEAPSSTPEVTAVVTEDPADTEEAVETEEVTETEEVAETEDSSDGPGFSVNVPDDLDRGAPSVSEDGLFNVSVSTTNLDVNNENFGVPPAGQQWVIVTATLANDSDEPVNVMPDDLTLIDEDGNRYPVFSPEDQMQPALDSAEIEAQSSIRGFARFSIPAGVTPTLFEWCFDGTCDEVVQSETNL